VTFDWDDYVAELVNFSAKGLQPQRAFQFAHFVHRVV